MAKFLVCEHCGNVVGMVKGMGETLKCCGSYMERLEANTVNASKEKHVPDVIKTENGINVKIGSAPHPMDEEHYIEFIYVKTERGGQRIGLSPHVCPEANFCFTGDEPLEVYSYCNIHGLWKVDI